MLMLFLAFRNKPTLPQHWVEALGSVSTYKDSVTDNATKYGPNTLKWLRYL